MRIEVDDLSRPAVRELLREHLTSMYQLSPEAFKPAQKLCESFGFVYCGPFGDYRLDPYSVFMSLALD
jgi:hypothetical protein